jgi:hypothetical protein
MTQPPTCPIHKSILRKLSSLVQTKEESLARGTLAMLECDVPGCPVKYSLILAPDWDGFFKLDENGKPTALKLSASNLS